MPRIEINISNVNIYTTQTHGYHHHAVQPMDKLVTDDHSESAYGRDGRVYDHNMGSFERVKRDGRVYDTNMGSYEWEYDYGRDDMQKEGAVMRDERKNIVISDSFPCFLTYNKKFVRFQKPGCYFQPGEKSIFDLFQNFKSLIKYKKIFINLGRNDLSLKARSFGNKTLLTHDLIYFIKIFVEKIRKENKTIPIYFFMINNCHLDIPKKKIKNFNRCLKRNQYLKRQLNVNFIDFNTEIKNTDFKDEIHLKDTSLYVKKLIELYEN